MHLVTTTLVFLIFSLTLLGNAASSKSRKPVLRKPSDSPKTGCYIIVIKDKANEEEIQELLTRVVKASDDQKMYGIVQKAAKAFTVKLSPYSLEMVRGMAAVDYIEEEGFATGDASDDLLQWHLDRLDQEGYPLDLSYSPIGTGEGVDIYILDSGINYDHEEFEYRAKYGGRDPMDEYTLTNDAPDNYQRQFGRDCHGHGTHVASLSGGKNFGTAKKANIYSVRVLSCSNSAPWSVVLDGIDFVSQVVATRKRPAVLSMSLSGNFYRVVNDMVANVVKQGIHVVVAAGNGQVDACTKSPASSATAITVGGTRNGDGLYLSGSGTNYGPCIDIFAPGERIVAADWTCANCCKVLSGTSMSTPITSGVVAVHLSREPLASPAQIKKKLVDESLNGVLSYNGIPQSAHANTPNKLLHLPGSCGGNNFFRTFSHLTSPDFPDPYPPNLDCVWHVRAEKGQQVWVNITWVNLEAKYDVLRIYEGLCCNRTYQVAEFTGNLGSLNYSYLSRGREVSLQLVTDGSLSAPGFNGSFTKVYSGTNIKVPDPEIELPTSPNGPNNGPRVVTLRSLSPKRARNEVNNLLEDGYKVTWITTHKGDAGQRHAFDVILTNNTLVDTRVFIDLNQKQLNDTIIEMSNQGYYAQTISDRERGNPPSSSVSYTALFVRREEVLETEVFIGDSLEMFDDRVSQMNSSGYRLLSQSFVEFRGRTEASSVFTRDRRITHNIQFDPPPALSWFRNVTFFEFTGRTLNFYRRNYYLSHLEVHSKPGDLSARFSVILVQHTDKTIASGNWFRWGLDETAVSALIAEQSVNWDTYLVNGYSHQGVVRFFIEFVRRVK